MKNEVVNRSARDGNTFELANNSGLKISIPANWSAAGNFSKTAFSRIRIKAPIKIPVFFQAGLVMDFMRCLTYNRNRKIPRKYSISER